jgi:hypothetical protein
MLYSSPNIIRQIKSRRIWWAGHVARMGEDSVQGFDEKARTKETTWKTKHSYHVRDMFTKFRIAFKEYTVCNFIER